MSNKYKRFAKMLPSQELELKLSIQELSDKQVSLEKDVAKARELYKPSSRKKTPVNPAAVRDTDTKPKRKQRSRLPKRTPVEEAKEV